MSRASPTKRLVLTLTRRLRDICIMPAQQFSSRPADRHGRRFLAFSDPLESLPLWWTLWYLQTSYFVIPTLFQGYFNVVRVIVPYGYKEHSFYNRFFSFEQIGRKQHFLRFIGLCVISYFWQPFLRRVCNWIGQYTSCINHVYFSDKSSNGKTSTFFRKKHREVSLVFEVKCLLTSLKSCR